MIQPRFTWSCFIFLVRYFQCFGPIFHSPGPIFHSSGPISLMIFVCFFCRSDKCLERRNITPIGKDIRDLWVRIVALYAKASLNTHEYWRVYFIYEYIYSRPKAQTLSPLPLSWSVWIRYLPEEKLDFKIPVNISLISK